MIKILNGRSLAKKTLKIAASFRPLQLRPSTGKKMNEVKIRGIYSEIKMITIK